VNEPRVSVVMSVYDGERYLRESVESVLAQTFTDFELIVVNDGSTDASREILAEFERHDSRLRVIDQENQGLTRALIRGCAEARGHYLARQDAGDTSLSTRLGVQVAYLDNHSEVALLSCWTQFLGPDNEELFLARRTDTNQEATFRLRQRKLCHLQGVTHHGSTMFRRADYLHVGGYRWQFRYAQDLDLWLRLTDLGQLAFIPEVLYLARFTPDCISMRSHGPQVQLARLAVESAKARQAGNGDQRWLDQAAAIGRARQPEIVA
jgi:glycosyltransferase involved in cell wall biosynthesis